MKSFLKLLFGALESLGRLDLFTVGTCAEGLNADVDAYRLGLANACRRYGFGEAVLVENGSPVVAAGIHRERDALDLAFDLPMHDGLDLLHLRHLDEVVACRNAGAMVAGLFAASGLEARISGFLLEEAAIGFVQIANRFLWKLFKSTLNNRLHRNLDCVIDKSSRGAKLKRAFEELPCNAMQSYSASQAYFFVFLAMAMSFLRS